MNFKGGKKEIVCEKCKKTFSVYPGSTARFCSRKCALSSGSSRSANIIKARITGGTFYRNTMERLCGKKFDEYKSSAKNRGLDFQFKKGDKFNNLILSNCSYCNSSPALGIDRVENEHGYTIENSIPCCSKCNFAKRCMTVVEFKEHIEKIYNHLILN